MAARQGEFLEASKDYLVEQVHARVVLISIMVCNDDVLVEHDCDAL